MLHKIIFLILLFVTTCNGFFSINISTIIHESPSRLNLTCSYYGGIIEYCDYCVYQFFYNGSSTTIYYDCIQITNTYKSISNRCQGFSDKTDIGYGICSPLSFELFDLSILCICATNMCNTNFTTCRSSVDYQVGSNLSPSLLPSIIADLSTPISCFDTIIELNDSENASYYCAELASPYINITECNEYVINNTVLCQYVITDGLSAPLAITEDIYLMALADTISTIIQYNKSPNIEQFYNETSSYFYDYSDVTDNYVNNDSISNNSGIISNKCFCIQNNCNYNLTTCFHANRSISVGSNAISKLFSLS
jgi:hypothetical protein